MIENSFLKMLSKGSIFGLIPDILLELESEMEIIYAKPGKALYLKGQKLEHLVIPLQEPLVLINKENVTLLQKGRTLALHAFLRNQPLPYDVFSEDYSKVLVVPREKFLACFQANPEILSYLMLMTESESFRRIKHMLTERGVAQSEISAISKWVSEPKEYSSSLLDEGIILFESGEFKIGGNNFEGHVSRGTFAGGFHIVHRPNPGYEIHGKGTVRVIDTKGIHKASLSSTVLEYLGSDPWIRPVISKRKDHASPTKISEEALKPFNLQDLSIDPEGIILSSSDWASISETITMAVKLFDQEVHRTLIENRLQRASETICMSYLAEIFEQHGLLTRLKSWKDHSRSLDFPLIIPFGGRIILLLDQDQSSFHCFDGVIGFKKIDKAYLRNASPDFGIYLTSLNESQVGVGPEEKKGRSKTLALIWRILSLEKKTSLRIATFTGLIYLLGALSPKLNQILLDEVLRTEDTHTLTMCLSGLALIGVFLVIFTHLRNILITNASLVFDDLLSRFVLSKSYVLSARRFAKLGTGEILNRISEMEKIRSFFSTESLGLVFGLGSTIIFGLMLASYELVLVTFVLAYFTLLFITQYFGRKYLARLNQKMFRVQSRTNSFIGDCISNILTIKAFSSAAAVSQTWEGLNQEITSYDQRSVNIESMLESFVVAMGQILRVSIIWYCVANLERSISFGEMFAIIQLVGQTISPMGGLVGFLSNLEDIKLSMDKVGEITHPEETDTETSKHSVNILGKIRFDRVSFRYQEDSPLVLKDVTFTVYPGQTVAIVGRSGSGKTTLAGLIAKEVNPTSGRIYFDDVDSTFICDDEIRSQLGYIQQSTTLFSGSIKSNVAYKDEAPDPRRLEEAYAAANCLSFIKAFPQADDTYLAEGGLGLSGGQRQRLTMARTLYTNPKILVLDEATSALDSESEGVIIQNMLKRKGDVTSIIIAHRLSTIRNVDYVYVVDGGKIVQEGTHNDLIQSEGVYQELFQDQSI